MCRIILSIKPEYVKRILIGQKTYEYRKIQCSKEIDSIIIYSSAPEKRVVGEVEVVGVLRKSPQHIWEETHNNGGISKSKFFDYYNGRDEAVAYKLGKVTVFDRPKMLSDYGVFSPPQSFVYVD